ncbi:MAG: protein TolR [Alphaproteobacteria bacterium]|nr:protein TolR [Alphaproteobacteria bacterium]
MVMLLRNAGGGRRKRRAPIAEINVTPFVDVMLVLLVVFMITAPLLASGVAVDLPKTRAAQLPSSDEQPLVVTVDRDGRVFVGTQDEPVEMEALAPMLLAVAQENLEKRVYVRGDEAVAYGKVIAVLSLLQGAGFRNAGMVVDPETAQRMMKGG